MERNKTVLNLEWSKKYKRCILCKTIERKHKGRGMCTKCYSLYSSKRWREKNREKERKRHRKYRKENIKKVRECVRIGCIKWRKENPEKALISNMRWKRANSEKIKKASRERYRKNSKKEIRRVLKYQKRNPEKIKECRRKWYLNKNKTDIHFRLKNSISKSIHRRLKKRLISKNRKSTFSFLPYTVDELKQHLEDLFEPWMNWNNWGRGKGKWNIDHKLPDCSFNYRSVDDRKFQKCWALENLQPLDAIENIKKGSKIISLNIK